MKREVLTFNRHVSGCCPGHDDYPNEKYNNNRSTKARSRDIKREHKYVRTLQKFELVNFNHLERNMCTGEFGCNCEDCWWANDCKEVCVTCGSVDCKHEENEDENNA